METLAINLYVCPHFKVAPLVPYEPGGGALTSWFHVLNGFIARDSGASIGLRSLQSALAVGEQISGNIFAERPDVEPWNEFAEIRAAQTKKWTDSSNKLLVYQ
jgi:hypothetical protein